MRKWRVPLGRTGKWRKINDLCNSGYLQETSLKLPCLIFKCCFSNVHISKYQKQFHSQTSLLMIRCSQTGISEKRKCTDGIWAPSSVPFLQHIASLYLSPPSPSSADHWDMGTTGPVLLSVAGTGISYCLCWWWSSFPKPCSALCWDSLWKGQISRPNEVRSYQIRDMRVLSHPHHKPVTSHETWCSCDIFFLFARFVLIVSIKKNWSVDADHCSGFVTSFLLLAFVDSFCLENS